MYIYFYIMNPIRGILYTIVERNKLWGTYYLPWIYTKSFQILYKCFYEGK